jgi:hypothetical protein
MLSQRTEVFYSNPGCEKQYEDSSSSSFSAANGDIVYRINQVGRRVQQLQGEIRTQLEAEFGAFKPLSLSEYAEFRIVNLFSYLQDSAKPSKPARIIDACAVGDVLGPDVRRHSIDCYVALELKEYRRIFRATDEAGHVDNISRRYAWYRRVLGTHELELGRVFPSEWKVGRAHFSQNLWLSQGESRHSI